jgi:RND family efflux transporter MFP subunit
MPAKHGEARNIIFHNERAGVQPSRSKRKEQMNPTNLPASPTRSRRGELAQIATPTLVLDWQDGPETDLGFRQQKLRLSFARFSLAPKVTAAPKRLALVSVVAITASLCGVLSACGPHAPVKSPVKVEVQRVELTQAAQTMTLTGEVRAQVESDLGFRVGGRITERLVDVGDHVSSGQILAKLDPRAQQTTVEAREADVRAAEARLRNETSNFERQKLLLSRKSTSPSEYDRAEESFRTAQSVLEAAKAQLGTARDALAQTELHADSAGTITTRNAEVGQVVEGAQPVFVLAHDGPRDAVFNVSESVLGYQPVDRNIQIDIKLVTDPSIHTTGKVREVTPTLSGTGGTVVVKVGLDESPPGIALGAAVFGEGPLSSQEAIAVPPGSLASVAGQPSVWIVDPATHAVSARGITIARYETHRVIVAAGLRPGDLVVTGDAQRMSPNQIVAIVEVH